MKSEIWCKMEEIIIMNKFIEKFSLEGKKAIVTGGAKGLCNGMAQALHDAGAEVVLLDILDIVEDSAKEMAKEGAMVTFFLPLNLRYFTVLPFTNQLLSLSVSAIYTDLISTGSLLCSLLSFTLSSSPPKDT